MARLEELLVSFEENFSLDELSAINTEEEALASPLRKSALLALEPIISHLKVLEERKDTSPETYQRLEKIYRRFSRAIGFCNTYAPGGSRHD